MKLRIWKWLRSDTAYLIVPAQSQLFMDSPTMRAEWKLIGEQQVVDPLERPIPRGYELVVAEYSNAFPYSTKHLILLTDVFNASVDGVYFLANAQMIRNLQTLCPTVSLIRADLSL